MSESEEKNSRLINLMERHHLDGIVLQRVSSFAWATCGAASYVGLTSTNGLAWLYIERNDRWVITTNIEATRLQAEELLLEQGWNFIAAPWHGNLDVELEKLIAGKRVGFDGAYPGALDLSGELVDLRANLVLPEQERFRILGRRCADIMESTLALIRPGMTEIEISGLLAGESEKRGVRALVNLVAVDERIFMHRHPLPTEKVMERYAMIVLGGRWRGLVCSVSRLVHFGVPPAEVRRKMASLAQVDASFISSTRPGNLLGDVLQAGLDTYSRLGYPGEWEMHHQGGLAGYEPREVKVIPGMTRLVRAGQVFAWNPTIAGTKMEDTILVGADGFENLTRTPKLPVIPVVVNGFTVETPDMLVVT